ncbi:hypothetical protein HELRODRAFT_168354 [Helobdella robusta]|uniref:Uncharacterized protein n=1 Tax=Helobdella robusta TaxID=6412 RepID=T1F0G3_HELRO|nr:hypothetical protein HELRODRAFT_168354 [Helobdella robusta]ESO09373.1 hypothetical protein HELRODRAFT_168354 [Helobdella robusta]
MAKKKTKRLDGDYGYCYHENSPEKTIYQKLYNKSYCQKGCQYTCLSAETLSACGCIFYKYAVFSEDNKNRRTCKTDNPDDEKCTMGVLQSSESISQQCIDKCYEPCEESAYPISLSSSVWPSESHKATLKTMLQKHHNNFSRNHIDDDYIKTNFGRFVVYFSTLTYTEHNETGSYELKQLLSDFGGILGLYIGFSVLTGVEFIELIYDLCLSGFNSRYIKKRAKTFQNNPKNSVKNSNFEYDDSNQP